MGILEWGTVVARRDHANESGVIVGRLQGSNVEYGLSVFRRPVALTGIGMASGSPGTVRVEFAPPDPGNGARLNSFAGSDRMY